MKTTDLILTYLIDQYQPDAIIAYGSFADGSANENSDFDALVIADHTKKHDAAVIGNTVLDVFVYPLETFRSEYDPDEYVQVSDGKIILDRSGLAAELKKRVQEHISQIPLKTEEEIREEIAWCEKMLSRTTRGDAEGYYRWHWLLHDSLEIYCDVRRLHYPGPKKALRIMSQTDSEAFRIYSLALKELNRDRLSEWIACLKTLSEAAGGGAGMIETDRIRIYPATQDQMETYIASETDGELKAAYTEMLEGCLQHPDQWAWYAMWMIERKDGTHLGDLCFKGLDANGAAEIGYGILEDYQGQGYATEAVRAASAWAFQNPSVTAVEAETDPQNKASQRVLEKCGFLPNGTTGKEGPRFTLAR